MSDNKKIIPFGAIVRDVAYRAMADGAIQILEPSNFGPARWVAFDRCDTHQEARDKLIGWNREALDHGRVV